MPGRDQDWADRAKSTVIAPPACKHPRILHLPESLFRPVVTVNMECYECGAYLGRTQRHWRFCAQCSGMTLDWLAVYSGRGTRYYCREHAPG